MQLLTYEDITEFPANSPTINRMAEYEDMWNTDIIPFIKMQIYQQENYGIDILQQYNIQQLDISFFIETIRYCDETYCSIPQLDDILSNEIKVNVIGRYVYQFYAVDGLELFEGFNPREITSSQVINILQSKIATLQLLNPKKIDPKVFKYLYYIDMLDNDISLLKQNWLLPQIMFH